jgi:hypothetical integral membrane protein (TIGR02206 family)
MAIWAWMFVLAAVLGTAAVLFRTIASRVTEQQARRIGKGIGAFMLVQEMADRMGHIFVLDQPISHNLPLHICGVSIIAVALLLIFRTQILFEFSYFAGLSGAVQAVLTPDVSVACPHPLFITYFSSHYLIFVGVLYALIVFRMRLDLRSLRSALFVTNLYAAIIFVVNYLFGTNYLFLRHKPHAETLMDFMGPWPIYIVGLELATLMSFILLYLFYNGVIGRLQCKT